MKKMDLHMHIMLPFDLPKIGKINLSGPKKMMAHMDELGIEKAVLMSSGEKKIPLGKNSICRGIAQKYPERFAWMCMLDEPRRPLLEEVLKKYPDLKILGHCQTFWIEISGDAPDEKEQRNSWGQGPVTEGGRVPALFAEYPNLYGDLSAQQCRTGHYA